jgi:hypothetical protein
MNDVGEPCAGEPHARFDRGPLAKRNNPAGRWSRVGALEHATTMTWTGPQPQQRSAEPAAYLTDWVCGCWARCDGWGGVAVPRLSLGSWRVEAGVVRFDLSALGVGVRRA